jgi:predicted RNase H-related nuclease YkuK (DUF458 family)
MWKTGNKVDIGETEMLARIFEHIEQKGKVVIGTDSMLTNKKFIFVNAVCLIGKQSNHHGKFFFTRYASKDEANKNLLVRLLKETTDSIEIANKLREKYPKANIEIHMDVNPSSKFLSGKYSSTVIGYILGCGYDYKIKPDAYAASAVADRHTRPTSTYIKKHYS